ncbi:MAG: serine hydrolase, partial [Flavipsychrobacter sp.]
MKKLLTFVLLFTGLCSTFAQPSDSVIQAIMSAGHLPGAEAVLIKDSHWVYDHSWGDANIDKHVAVNRETIFMMAS